MRGAIGAAAAGTLWYNISVFEMAVFKTEVFI